MKQRVLSVLLLLCLCIGTASCGGKKEPQKDLPDVPDSIPVGEYYETESGTDGDAILLVSSDYLILYGEGSDCAASVFRFAKAIQDQTGGWISSDTDRWIQETDDAKEILIGITTRRSNVNTEDVLYYDYGWQTDGSRIVIWGGSPEAVDRAVARFAEKYYDAGVNDFRVPSGVRFLARYQYPYADITVGNGSLKNGSIAAGEGYEAIAETVRAEIGKRLGIKMKITETPDAPEVRVRVGVDCSEDGWQTGYSVDGDVLVFTGNGRTAFTDGLSGMVAALFEEKLPITATKQTKNLNEGCYAMSEPTIQTNTGKVIDFSASSSAFFSGSTDKNAISYRVGEKIVLRIQLKSGTSLMACPYFGWTLKTDDGTVTDGVAEGSTGEWFLETTLQKPGFFYLKVNVLDEKKNVVSAIQTFEGGGCAGFSEIEKTKSEPDGFDAFWNGELSKLDAVTPELLSCVEDPAQSNASFTVYRIKVKSYSGTYGDFAAGYLTVPANAQKESLALRLTFQSAVTADPIPVLDNRTAVFSVCAHAVEVGGDYSKIGNYGFNPSYNSNRDTVYFKEMLLRDVQAVRFLMRYFGASGSDPRFAGLWNGKTLTVSGGSQGGFQCIAVAALQPDAVTFVNTAYPWLCDIGGSGAEGHYASTYMPSYTFALEYFDTVNFGKRLQCGISINPEGLGDTVALPRGVACLWNNLPDSIEKTLTFEQDRTHGRGPKESFTYTLD